MATALPAMVQVHIARPAAFKTYEFLLLERSAEQKIHPGLWQVVTGKKKEGETFVECAIRESYEETKLVPAEMWALPFVASFFLPQDDAVVHSPAFGVLVDEKSEIVLSKEHAASEWLPFDEAIKKLVMPSHKMGTEVFLREILLKENRELFKIHGF